MILLGAALWIDPLTGLTLVNLLGRVADTTIARTADSVFAWEQLVTWALFVCLLGFLTEFVRIAVKGLAKETGAVDNH